MCDRNINGGKVNQFLKGHELTLEDIKKVFTTYFCNQLERIYFCGNYGDPIIAKDLLESLQYLKEQNNKLKLSVITNGSARSEYWWKNLAKVTSSVRFGIDGLSDTNEIYRQGASWTKIILNVKAFINAGGYAIWDYLVFGHNEHQIEEARKLSKRLGFKEFVVKKTGRFFSNLKLEGKNTHKGLEKPSEDNINPALKKEKMIKEKYGSMEKYLDQTDIKCKVQKNNEIYLSAEGIVLPCCWLAGQMYKWYLPKKSTEIWEYVDQKQHNIHNHTIKEIFETGLFDHIEETWNKKSLWDGKLKTCALKCGKELDQFGDQYK
jgi:sulfatase maturation enzyme AslB (radical SAM superfamily)